MISGKKTYLAAGLAIVCGIAGLVAGVMEPAEAGQYILFGLTAIFARLGIAKVEEKAE